MLRHIKGIVSFTAITDNPENFINNVRLEKAACFDIEVKDCTIRAKTYRHDMKCIRRVASKTNTDVEIVGKKGIVFKIIRYRKRYGIIAGLIFAFTVIFYCSNTVMRIDISGNYLVSDDKILAVLNSNGVKYGSFIPEINTGNVQRRILVAYDELSWVTVRASDGRVVVDVTEAVEKPEMSPIH